MFSTDSTRLWFVDGSHLFDGLSWTLTHPAVSGLLGDCHACASAFEALLCGPVSSHAVSWHGTGTLNTVKEYTVQCRLQADKSKQILAAQAPQKRNHTSLALLAR